MAMQEICTVNPDAKLIQTEDLAKCYSTPLLRYQAYFENQRRWLSYDLLCGKVTREHYMWQALVNAGIKEDEILYFAANPCIPYIAGFNYYLTSQRFLSERLSDFPEQYHGGNNVHRYADVDTFLAPQQEAGGPDILLTEAWNHLHLPLAITECHLNGPCEHRMDWMNYIFGAMKKLKSKGIDIRALTVWALFGSFGWNRLVTKPGGDYEPGVFDVSSGFPQNYSFSKDDTGTYRI